MKKKFCGLCIIALIPLLLVSIMSCSSPATTESTVTTTKTSTATVTSTSTTTSKVVTWKIQAFVAPGNIMYDGYLVPFAELANERLQGKIKLELYPAGAILSAPEILKGVGAGVVQMGMGYPGYDVGIIPEAHIPSNLPIAITDATQPLDFLYNYQNGAAINELNAVYNSKGVQILSISYVHDPNHVMTTFPVTDISDFQGKKIRSAGTWAEAVKATGATQTNMALGDVYTGLQTGVIDGVSGGISTLEEFKWKEILKYVVEPAWHYGGCNDIIVNLDEWNNLPDDVKTILQDTAREVAAKNLVPYSEEKYLSIHDAATAAGVQFVTLPGNEGETFKSFASAPWNATKGLTPGIDELMKLFESWCNENGLKYPGN